jgi:hypothetical protein
MIDDLRGLPHLIEQWVEARAATKAG